MKPKYSGPNRSGICVCGCPWNDHHLGVVMNQQYAKETGEGYVPQECEAFGFNEVGGMKWDGSEWQDHCHGYRDQGEIMESYQDVVNEFLEKTYYAVHPAFRTLEDRSKIDSIDEVLIKFMTFLEKR